LPACYCGRTGCIETYLSGPGLAADHLKLTDERLNAEEIAARRGEALGRYEERLARALASVINVLDPDVIVLGGGMSNVERLYTEVPRLWSKHVFSDHVATRGAQCPAFSGVRGAAWLWDECRGEMKPFLAALTFSARYLRVGQDQVSERLPEGVLYQTVDRADIKQYRSSTRRPCCRRGAKGKPFRRRGAHAGAVGVGRTRTACRSKGPTAASSRKRSSPIR
jgi:hypothetical protein